MAGEASGRPMGRVGRLLTALAVALASGLGPPATTVAVAALMGGEQLWAIPGVIFGPPAQALASLVVTYRVLGSTGDSARPLRAWAFTACGALALYAVAVATSFDTITPYTLGPAGAGFALGSLGPALVARARQPKA